MVLKVTYAFLIFILLILSIVLVLSVRSDFDLDNPPVNPSPTDTGCTISTTKDLVELSPLLLQQNEATETIAAFVLPTDNGGKIKLKSGDKIDFACPGENIIIVDGVHTPKTILEATCESGLKFTIEGKSVLFDAIKCFIPPESAARYTGKDCGEEKKEIEVGFKVFNRFIRQLLICYDDKLQTSLYSRADITSAVNTPINKPQRPMFREGDFYNVASHTLVHLYSIDSQRETINTILGLPSNDISIIKDNRDYFLSKGHYAAMADFLYAPQQIATFWFVNTAPQWQTFNGGNWNSMEIDCRNLASSKKLDLTVITGSYGISKLLDTSKNKQELYLFKESETKGIPVPQLFFRVVYDSKSESGVAIVGVNNPFNKYDEDVICKDVCDKIKWLTTWNRKNVTMGYSYCCEVNDLRKTIKFIPELSVKSLLV